MHLEILVEDSSGHKLLEILVPKILGNQSEHHTWRIFSYKGIGRIPLGLSSHADPSKRILLDNLPRIIRGYGRTPWVDHLIVVVDTDRRSCAEFLDELQAMLARCEPKPATLFRLAIEEMEAWLLGDQNALLAAYPTAKREVLSRYRQDEICGTWEMLADAIHPGGAAALKRLGFVATGTAKHEWAEKIGPHLALGDNASPSFRKFVNGLRRVAPI